MSLISLHSILRGLPIAVSIGLAALSATVLPAAAHPHVWVSVSATLQFKDGALTGIEQHWIFDEFYSGQASEGLDKNHDGKLDRSELAELAQVNMEGLKEFDYFTEARAAARILNFEEPKDVYLEEVVVAQPPGPDAGGPVSNDGTVGPGGPPGSNPSGGRKVLALTFTLPLQKPVRPDQEAFQFTVDDPTYFIWLEYVKDQAVKLAAGAPKGCKVAIGAAEQTEEQKRLADAFTAAPGMADSPEALKTVRLVCSKD